MCEFRVPTFLIDTPKPNDSTQMIFATQYKHMAEHVYCGDFNLCFKCYRHASSIHFQDHRFISIQ